MVTQEKLAELRALLAKSLPWPEGEGDRRAALDILSALPALLDAAEELAKTAAALRYEPDCGCGTLADHAALRREEADADYRRSVSMMTQRNELRKRIAELALVTDRVVSIVDGACGMQPVQDPQDLLTLLEKHLFEQRMRIAELEAEDRWIPVLERKPPTRTTVLAIDTDGDVYTAEHDMIWTDTGACPIAVTHWRPLPKPPESQ